MKDNIPRLNIDFWNNNNTRTQRNSSLDYSLGSLRNRIGSTTRIHKHCLQQSKSNSLECTFGSYTEKIDEKPNLLPKPHMNLFATSEDGKVIISFIPVFDNSIDIIDYLYSIDGITYISSGSNSSPITISGLTNGQTYNITLKAVNKNGTSNISTSAMFIPSTIPEPPTILNATPGSGEAIVTFIPGLSLGSPITDYLYSIDGYTYVSSGSTSSPITITGLTNGQTYNITLKSVNINGNSNSSNSVSITPDNASLLPPQLTGVSSKTENSITITFTQETNGITITNYKYSIDGGNTYTAFLPIDITSPVTISGLTSDTTYNICLKAVSSVGESLPSNIITEKTYIVNYAVFTNVGSSTWTAPENVTFVQYLVVGGGGGGGSTYSKINILGDVLVTGTPQAGKYWINSVHLTNGRYSGRMYFSFNSGQNSSSFPDPIRLTASENFTPTGVVYSYNKWYNTEMVYILNDSLVLTSNYVPPYQINSTQCNNDSGGSGGGAGGQVKIITGTNKYNVTPGTTYQIIVGAGGKGGIDGLNTEINGSPGENSSFDTIISLGGSGGAFSRNMSQVQDTNKFGKGGNGGVGYGNFVGGSGGGQTNSNNYGRFNSGGPGASGSYINFDGNGNKFYGGGGNGGVPNIVATGTTLDNIGKGGNGTGATLNSYSNGIDGGSGIVIIKYYT